MTLSVFVEKNEGQLLGVSAPVSRVAGPHTRGAPDFGETKGPESLARTSLVRAVPLDMPGGTTTIAKRGMVPSGSPTNNFSDFLSKCISSPLPPNRDHNALL